MKCINTRALVSADVEEMFTINKVGCWLWDELKDVLGVEVGDTVCEVLGEELGDEVVQRLDDLVLHSSVRLGEKKARSSNV